jgi:ATP-binding cassette, subfamily B, multidrug efflux pump
MLKQLRPLFPYLKRYKSSLLWGAVFVVVMNSVWAIFPQVLGAASDDLDRVTKHKGVLHHSLLFYASVLLAIAIAKGVFQFLIRWILIGVSRDIEFDLRNDLLAHLETLSYSYYQRTRTGDIMAKATNDLNAVRMLLGPAIMYSANTIMYTATALYFMIKISPRLTLFTFIPLPIASIVVQYFGSRIHERFERIQAQFSEISARTQENFSGARIIRAFAQEDAEIRLFEKDNQEYIARGLKLVRLMGMLWPTLEAMLGVAVVLVLWLGGRQVIEGHMTPGKFVAYLTYMVQLTWPIIALGWVINIFQRGTASMGRINQILTEKPEIVDSPQTPALANHPIAGDIEFRNLSFKYPDGSTVLHNIKLKVPEGTSLAIVGPTGSGKSTLVSLIPRIYDTPRDEVLLDGRSLQDYPLSNLRHSIGFVPQETFLFSDTIRENIAFGIESATDEQIRQAAQGSSIAQDIEGFPEGYNTMVGERGITLSGGQKQRTAIARALIRNPRILILDDALSSVDTYTEERILEHLKRVMEGRTTIFISHRVSTVRNADQIAVLSGGRIVELGKHEDLLALNGYYAELYNKQLLEEELETV